MNCGGGHFNSASTSPALRQTAVMPRVFSFLALAGLLLLVVPTQAASLRGQPLMQRYTSEDYPSAPSHLAVTSDASGAPW